MCLNNKDGKSAMKLFRLSVLFLLSLWLLSLYLFGTPFPGTDNIESNAQTTKPADTYQQQWWWYSPV
jgi:hypothetical protein